MAGRAFLRTPEILFITPIRVGVEQGAVGEAVARRLHPDTVVVPFATPARAADALAGGP